MKKQFTALLLTILMICYALCGCEYVITSEMRDEKNNSESNSTDTTDSSGEASKSDYVETRTPKSAFLEELSERIPTVDFEADEYEFLNILLGMKVYEDGSEDSTMSIGLDLTANNKGDVFGAQLDVGILDEVLPIIVNGEGENAYFSIPNVTDLPLMLKTEEILTIFNDYTEEDDEEEESTIYDSLKILGEKYLEYFESGKLDGLFSYTKEDFLIGDEKYPNADIVKLYFTEEKVKIEYGEEYSKIFNDIYNIETTAEIVLSDGEYTAGKFVSSVECFLTDGAKHKVAITIRDTANFTEIIIKETIDGETTHLISFNRNTIDGKVKITANYTEAYSGSFENEDGTYSDYAESTAVLFEYKENDENSADGKINIISKSTFDDDTQTEIVTIPYSYGISDEGTHTVEVKEIKASTGDGATVSIAIDLTVLLDILESGFDASISFDMDVQGVAIGFDLDFAMEFLNGFVPDIPEEYIPEDQMSLEEFQEKLSVAYPTIWQYINEGILDGGVDIL